MNEAESKITTSFATDEEVLQEALKWHTAGKKVAIATVIDIEGSASRPVGGHLIVDGEGTFLGSVSGGCVETDVIIAALEVIETGSARLLEFGVSDAALWQPSLPCGKIKVYVERLD